MSAEWAEQPAAPSAHTIPGAALAAQREAMGWSVEQVAEQLKLAVRQVAALEAGDYAALPGPAVVRGFIRAYAKVVKLDAAPLVAMVALETPEPGDATGTTVKRERPATFSEVRFPTQGRRSGLPLGWIAAAVAVAVAAALAWQFHLIPAQWLHAEVGTPAVASETANAAGQPSMTELAAPMTASPTVVKTDPAAANGIVEPDSITVAAPETAPAPAAAAPVYSVETAPAAGPNTLVLSASADSWVEVKPAKGAALFSRLMRAGSRESVEIHEPVTLVVGKPAGVVATLRGTAVELPASPGSTIARVSIK